MTHLTAAGVLLAADTDTRILTGRLLPYAEKGSTSAGLVATAAGAVTWPEQVSDVILNLSHDRDRPVGRATSIVEDATGLTASFQVARTPAGDQLLAEASEGLRRGLSVELDGISIRGGQLLAGHLTDVGAVVRPAFPSAQLTAADAGPDPTEQPPAGDPPPSATTTTVDCPVCGEQIDLTVSPPTDTPTIGGYSCPHCAAVLDITTPTTEPLPEAPPMTEPVLAARPATTPALAAAAARPTARPRTGQYTIRSAASLVAAAAHTGPQAMHRSLTAALADVVAGDGTGVYGTVQEASWLGELWNGRDYQRRYVGLVAAGTVTGLKVRGWRWKTPPKVQDYAGNKAAVPSNPVEVEAVEAGAERCAGAWDIDRAYWDLGATDFIESFWRMTAESYARLSDLRCAEAIIAAATANPAPAGTVPAGVSTGLAAIVDGALSLLTGATADEQTVIPSFAIVAADLYRDVLLTRSDDTLSYLNAALGLEDGTISGFRIQPAPTWIIPAGTVAVGAKEALTFYELGSVPIRVEAEDVARGGRDLGAFGYTGSIVNEPAALTLVTTA